MYSSGARIVSYPPEILRLPDFLLRIYRHTPAIRITAATIPTIVPIPAPVSTQGFLVVVPTAGVVDELGVLLGVVVVVLAVIVIAVESVVGGVPVKGVVVVVSGIIEVQGSLKVRNKNVTCKQEMTNDD